MMTIQTLRRSRGITLTDLALLSGISTRTLASIEYGLQKLDHRTRDQLAHIFAVPAESLLPGAPPALQEQVRRRLVAQARAAAPLVGLALASAAVLAPALQPYVAPPPAPVGPPVASLAQPRVSVPVAAPLPAPVSLGLAADVPQAERLAAMLPVARAPAGAGPASLVRAKVRPVAPSDGTPTGCPIASDGRVVVTQGYDVGTHAPAAAWGALDLALDPGSGIATLGSLVFTPNAGVARVVLNSWPGGNYVRITNDTTGWATAYAHLDQVFVTNGQAVEAGTPIGTVGLTGMTTGPHLHYEVWRNGVNVDPSPYVRCDG